MTDVDLLSRFLLPILIGFILGVLSAFTSWVVEMAKMRRTNREVQLQLSTEICKKIIDALDVLFSHMNDDAWYIAWRKVQTESHYPAELTEGDRVKWDTYKECLDQWRGHNIGYETELKAFFGSAGYEAFLFLDISAKIEQVAAMLWNVYYAPQGGGEGCTIPTWKDGKPVIEKQIFDASEASQLKSMEEYFSIMDQIRDRISTLSSTMIHCIQVQNVGNLAEDREPVPESDREEAKALLGGSLTQRNLSKANTENKV